MRRRRRETPVVNLADEPNGCQHCGGYGWQQRVSLIRRRVKARPCPHCKEKS